jgi:hypothetical protein
MRANQSVLERAFEMAQSGEFRTLEPLVRQLSKEGYINPERHLLGPSLRRQLLDLIRSREAPGTALSRCRTKDAERFLFGFVK